MKKLLAVILATLFAVSCVPFAAFAAQPEPLAAVPEDVSQELEEFFEGIREGVSFGSIGETVDKIFEALSVFGLENVLAFLTPILSSFGVVGQLILSVISIRIFYEQVKTFFSQIEKFFTRLFPAV